MVFMPFDEKNLNHIYFYFVFNACHITHMEVKGQLLGGGFLSLYHVDPWADCQVWGQISLPTEPTCWPIDEK